MLTSLWKLFFFFLNIFYWLCYSSCPISPKPPYSYSWHTHYWATSLSGSTPLTAETTSELTQVSWRPSRTSCSLLDKAYSGCLSQHHFWSIILTSSNQIFPKLSSPYLRGNKQFSNCHFTRQLYSGVYLGFSMSKGGGSQSPELYNSDWPWISSIPGPQICKSFSIFPSNWGNAIIFSRHILFR